ncbi:MAG: flavin reductase family protein [Burkholderiales bacterium]|nr:flavin reductase family protein [Burkholderiales bacterium]
MSVQALAAGDYEEINPGSLDRAHRYKLFTGTVIPRPIALVTTLGELGQVNAAPFSQFVIVAVDPGMLGFSIGPGPRGDKDTLVNVRREREFVINTVTSPLAQIVQHCGEDMPPDVSEVEVTGLGVLPSVHVRAPRIAQSRVQFECRLERIVEVGSAPNHFVIGEVLLVHIEKGLHEDCRIDTRRYDPIGRLGGRNYSRLGDIIET